MKRGRGAAQDRGRGRARGSAWNRSPARRETPTKPASSSPAGSRATRPHTAPSPQTAPRGVLKQPMRRIGSGKEGRRLKVQTNFFHMNVGIKKVHQYAVRILRPSASPEGKNPQGEIELVDMADHNTVMYNENVFKQWAQAHTVAEKFAYDGRKIAYSAQYLDLSKKRYGFAADRDGKQSNGQSNVWVEVSWTATWNVGDESHRLPLTAALDTVIGYGMKKTHFQIGRSFYSNQNATQIGEGVQAWAGFYLSAQVRKDKFLVNIDQSYSPFWSYGESLVNLLSECRIDFGRALSQGRLEAECRRAKKLFEGLKVRTRVHNIPYRIHGFDPRGANQIEFEDPADASKRITVAAYFERKYGCRINNNQLPCVKTHPRRDTFVPLEILYVKDEQRFKNSLSSTQTTKMLESATSRPNVRMNRVQNFVSAIERERDPMRESFQIQIQPHLTEIEARVLPPPTIHYQSSGGGGVQQSAGKWRAPHNAKFHTPTRTDKWLIYNLSNRVKGPAIHQFAKGMQDTSRKLGMNFGEYTVESGTPNNSVPQLQRLVNSNKDVGFVLIIINAPDVALYSRLKKAADIEIGIPSQVITAKNLKRQTINNILLKVNLKLGGTNFIARYSHDDFPFKIENTIILGADVTHPTGNSDGASIAALVGSVNKEGTQFSSCFSRVEAGKEEITDMKEMFRKAYLRWHGTASRRTVADSVIMFRDGVSEGQFQKVMDIEVEGIRRSCMSIHKALNPKITYIICTKRHHARFCVASQSQSQHNKSRNQSNRVNNCPPGTVIDSGIVSEHYHDFYLNSHEAILGTSRCTKYTVLLDENGMTPDQLEKLVYRYAYEYGRCTRSVSIASPAYFAHHLAFRVRKYVSAGTSDAGSQNQPQNAPQFPKEVHDKLRRRLFYM